ncbi:MAG: hypothetical protein QOH96_173 [Blastocatellia bacterium]|nr:hypothetical protein [Blastocatellia bacterium]
MTEEKRAATVSAVSEVECYRPGKESITEIVTHRIEIAEDISHIMARRRVELEAIREGLDEDAKGLRINQRQGDILHRILRLFGTDQDEIVFHLFRWFGIRPGVTVRALIECFKTSNFLQLPGLYF